MKGPVDEARLPPGLHPRVRFLIERCLEKDRSRRSAAIGEVRSEIDKALSDPESVFAAPPEKGRRGRAASVAAATVLAVGLAALAVWNLKPEPPGPIVHFSHTLEEGAALRRPFAPRSRMALGPDGSLIYAADGQLYMRRLSELDAFPIRGTDEAPEVPVVSPDGEWIADYPAPRRLRPGSRSRARARTDQRHPELGAGAASSACRWIEIPPADSGIDA